SIKPVPLDMHTKDVKREAEGIVRNLHFPNILKNAVVLAAQFHDLGKRRELWQRSIGNPNPQNYYAKSGKPDDGARWRHLDISSYRHEFGSALDVLTDRSHRTRLDDFSDEVQDLILHLIAAHHGRARPHFPLDEVFDPDHQQQEVDAFGRE